MTISLKKLWNDYGIGAILVLLVVAYGVSLFVNYLSNKGVVGAESNQEMQEQYKHSQQMGVQPSEDLGSNGDFAQAMGDSGISGLPSSCSSKGIQNPDELLPQDVNSQWAQLNPSGKGELANVNLLKAGYHIGIDTVGQSLRNANLQIRSEPPNPQLYVGPWMNSTITPDLMRPPLEIGSGPQ